MSGVGGWYPSRRLHRSEAAGDIRQQTADALDLMKALLEEAGGSMADLLQVQVALVALLVADIVIVYGSPRDLWHAAVGSFSSHRSTNRPRPA